MELAEEIANSSEDNELIELVAQAIEARHVARANHEQYWTEQEKFYRQKEVEKQMKLVSETSQKQEAKRRFEGLLDIIHRSQETKP